VLDYVKRDRDDEKVVPVLGGGFFCFEMIFH